MKSSLNWKWKNQSVTYSFPLPRKPEVLEKIFDGETENSKSNILPSGEAPSYHLSEGSMMLPPELYVTWGEPQVLKVERQRETGMP